MNTKSLCSAKCASTSAQCHYWLTSSATPS